MRSPNRALAAAAIAAAAGTPAGAGTITTVSIESGQVLTEADLLAGVFEGQEFVLGPDTVFEVNDGGALGPIGLISTNPFESDQPFDFGGAAILFNPGSASAPSQTYLSRASVRVMTGASIGDIFWLREGVLEVEGGDIGRFLRAESGTDLRISSGAIGSNAYAREGSSVSISGGTVGAGFDTASGSVVDISGGDVALQIARGDVRISGGTVHGFSADPGSDVVITGGKIRSGLRADFNSRLIIAGGIIGDRFNAGGGEVHISGGAFGSRFVVHGDSSATLEGTGFRLNGVPVTNLDEGLSENDVFTGTLADGSVFIFSSRAGGFQERSIDSIGAGGLTLVPAAPPVLSPLPQTVLSGDGPATGLRPGETLIVGGSAEVRDFFAVVSATLRLEGGSIGRGLEVADALVEVTAGSIGHRFDVHAGSEVRIEGGELFSARVFESAFSMSGGVMRSTLSAMRGSQIAVTGQADIKQLNMTSSSGEMLGGLLRSADVDSSEFNVAGSSFVQSLDVIGDSSVLLGGKAYLRSVSTEDQAHVEIDGARVDVWNHHGASASMRGGSIGEGAQILAPMTVHGGIIGERLSVFADGAIEMFGGEVLDRMSIAGGASASLFGGRIGSLFQVFEADVTVAGATIGEQFTITDGAVVDVRSGVIEDFMRVRYGGTINIRGGVVGAQIRMFERSEMNLFVRELAIDGVPIDLRPNQLIEILDRSGARLEAILSDGSYFDLDLNTSYVEFEDLLYPDATLTATLVPTPPASALLLTAAFPIAMRRRRVRA